MTTDRLLKWSKKSQKFFEESADKSLDLTFMVSQANESQTGDGFEEFVNSINELNINRKIKKVTIIDTTFLYRHCVPDFSQHLDKNIPTMWFLNNENTIKKINCDVLLESYVDQVNTDLFKEWHKKIVDDFSVVKD